MKSALRGLLFFCLAAFGLRCRTHDQASDLLSVKVFVFYSADSITAFNKDLGISNYLYYDFESDSILYRNLIDVNPINVNPNRYETYVGHLDNEDYVDTIRHLLRVLSRHKNGIIPDSAPDGAVYCGPDFYVEYRDKSGEHYHEFILVGNDTLNQFSHFFGNLPALRWKRNLVSNTVVNPDSEVVTAMKKLELYDERETPYIPLQCDSGIVASIVGSWRFVNSANKKVHTFSKLIFSKNGVYMWEKIRENKPTFRVSGRYVYDVSRSKLTIRTGASNLQFKVLTLTANCLRYVKEGEEVTVQRLDRIVQ